MNHIVLEMFTFPRVVVDEFPYAVPTHAGEDVRRFIVRLSAHAKWLLSGTPPLHSCADIKSMAELIGVHLGIDDYSSLPADAYRLVLSNKTRELFVLKICVWCNATCSTETEKFMLYQPPPSPFWVKRRDELAQRFLDQYLRMVSETSMYQLSRFDAPRMMPPAMLRVQNLSNSCISQQLRELHTSTLSNI